jgi:hypothetical protein
MAIKKLKDQKVLAGIAKNGMYSDERSAAKQRLENLKTGK